MGALATVVSTWIPEDDLLLKNAIEAGASLESLAKGAVRFSRKFTIKELQDRWHSLLYNPVVSEEASSRIIEFERSACSLSSKFGRAGNSKDGKRLSGKRRPESVRSCYYALRKRIRNEPFNTMDLSFLIAPNDDNYVGMEDGPLPGNCMLGDPISDDFGVQETNMDILDCSFPQLLADGGAAAMDECKTHGFQTANHNQDDGGFPVEPVNIHEDVPHMLGDNQFLLESGSGIDELPGNNMFDAGGLKVKPSSPFDQINNGPENICSEFGDNQVFNSPIVDCGLSIWQTDEGLSASANLGNCHGEKDLQGGDIYALPGGVTKSDNASGHDVSTDSKLESDMPCEEMENRTADTEGYLVEITNTLMNDEPFFMDVDGKDVIDKSYFDGLSSFLASSPNNCDQDRVPDVTEAMTSETQDNLANVSCSPNNCYQDQMPMSCDSEVPMISSVLASNSQFGVICCTMNTEDPEIPCNEGAVFSQQLCASVVSSTQHVFKEVNPLSSCVKYFSGGQKTSDEGPHLVPRDQTHGSPQMNKSQMIPQTGPQMNKSQMIPQTGQLHPVSDCRVKFEDSSCVASKNDGFLANGSAQVNSKTVNEGTLQPTLPKTKSEDIIPGKHLSHSSADTLIEKPTLCSDNSFAVKQEMDAKEKIKDHQASSAEVGPMDVIPPEPVVDHPPLDIEELMDVIPPEPVVDHPPLDIEELMDESDGDVPCFSDIEAMIHDTDLVPDDEDLCDEEVGRYQNEVTRRTIIMLEQCCHAFIRRDIASHGAFAILLGRHSKHYIKKPEILLGRTTEDFVVDIDLGREGCNNKVSRRQAIIKMEDDGSFHLKNLGKCSVLIGSGEICKEVAPGQSLSLSPGCYIQVRGMPFIFETNHI